MASRKMKLKREHRNFNVPITIISEEEANKRIVDALKDTAVSQDVSVEQSSETNLEAAAMTQGNVRTFSGIAYSGKPIEKHFMFENLYLDVDGMTFKENIPIFKNHDPSKIIGFGQLSRQNGELLIEGILATDIDEARDIAALSDAGFPWELSVGVEPAYIEEISQDKEFSINGTTAQGKAVIFRQPTVMETSFVPIGADRNTQAEVFNKDLNKYKNIEVRNMDITTIKVDGKDVEVTKNESGNFSILMDVESLDMETEYTFCACMESDEKKKKKEGEVSLSDEVSARDERIAELEEIISEFKTKEKRAKFNKAVETSSIELGDEEFASLSLLPEEQFQSFLNKIENTKVVNKDTKKSHNPSKELFAQDKPALELSSDDSVESWTRRAKALQKKFKEETGKELSHSDAISRLMA